MLVLGWLMQILCSFHLLLLIIRVLLASLFICYVLSTDDDTAEYLYDAITAKGSLSQWLVQERQITAQAIRRTLQELRDTSQVYEERVAAVWAMLTSRPRAL